MVEESNMITRLILRNTTRNRWYVLLLSLMIGMNLGLALWGVNLGFNGQRYLNDYIALRPYYRNVTYMGDFDTNLEKRSIEINYVDEVRVNGNPINTFSIGYFDLSSFLLSTEMSLKVQGNPHLEMNEAVVMKSAFEEVMIGDTLSITTDSDTRIVTVKLIIEDSEPFLKYQYPDILVHQNQLSQKTMTTVVLNDLSDLDKTDLNHAIHYKDTYGNYQLSKQVITLIMIVLILLFYSVAFLSFKAVFSNIVEANKDTFQLLKLLGQKKLSLYINLVIVRLVYALLAFMVSIGMAYIFNYILFEVINPTLIIDTSVFNSSLQLEAILILLVTLVLSTVFEAKLLQIQVMKAGEAYA